MKLLPLLAVLPALLLATAVQAQSVHKCVGPDGRTSFSDAPCPAEKKSSTVKVWDNAIEGSGLPPRDTVQRLDGEPVPRASGGAPGPARAMPTSAGRIGPSGNGSCAAFDRFAQSQGGSMLVEANYASYLDLARACDHERAADGDDDGASCAKVRAELGRRIDPGRGDPVGIAALLAAQNGCQTRDLKRAAREAREAREAQAARQPKPFEHRALSRPEPPRMTGPGTVR